MSRASASLGGTLCIGVANDLIRRIYEHRMGLTDGFSKKYGVHRLVQFEPFGNIALAIRPEKRRKTCPTRWVMPAKAAPGKPGSSLVPRRRGFMLSRR